MTDAAAERFAADLLALVPHGTRIGVAVSGGPDSLALLLLAARVRPGEVEAATVDHRLRPESANEAKHVAGLCRSIGVPHSILPARWSTPPSSSVQARARHERYALLARWAGQRGLGAIATAHHADDQAETLLMRLGRGAGVGGLAGARPIRPLAKDVMLVRPVLSWRKMELAAIVAAADVRPVDDPSNRDPHYDRTGIRHWIAESGWADPVRLAASAGHLREADEALDWALAQVIAERLRLKEDGVIEIHPHGLPREIQRRLLLAAFDGMNAERPDGPGLMRAHAALAAGQVVTLGGLQLAGGEWWRLTAAPPRTPLNSHLPKG